MRPDLTDAERIAAQFRFATTLVHETAVSHLQIDTFFQCKFDWEHRDV